MKDVRGLPPPVLIDVTRSVAVAVAVGTAVAAVAVFLQPDVTLLFAAGIGAGTVFSAVHSPISSMPDTRAGSR